MKPAILTVESLNKKFYLHEQKAVIPSFEDVNLKVYPGKLTALVGPTGCGKTSILKCIYRTYLPQKGKILYLNANGRIIDLTKISEQSVLYLRKNEISFVTQFLHCLPRKKAIDVVSEPLISNLWSKSDAYDAAAKILKILNIPERLWHIPPATFSGGEKQRINLAKGLILRPRLLLIDEPTASLDPDTTEKVIDLIIKIKHEGVGIVAIFHHPHIIERLADDVVNIDQNLSNKTVYK